MKRVHKRLFRINERIVVLERELSQTSAELEYHRSLDDDAQRDAATGNYIDREEAGLTAGDVRRFERAISAVEARLDRLRSRRERLLSRLPD